MELEFGLPAWVVVFPWVSPPHPAASIIPLFIYPKPAADTILGSIHQRRGKLLDLSAFNARPTALAVMPVII